MATTRSNTFHFEPNVPYRVTLRYRTGREVSNGRIMFSTTKGETIFLDPADARKIHALGLGENEPFLITKLVDGKNTEFSVSRMGSGQPVGTAAPGANASASQQPLGSSEETSQPQGISLSRKLAGCYIAAIDALLTVREYAKAKGIEFRVSEEEIRTAAHCTFIEAGKSEERGQRRREFDARYGWQQQSEPKALNGGAAWPRQ